MRELKFRVWDKIHEKYREPMVYDISNEKIVVRLPIETLKKGEFLLEQYTGLKDKNGKEIYEGDIVQIDSMDELRVGYVELVADQYCIVCGEDEEGYKVVAEFYYYSKPEENCEVIGNIHENEELLEEE